MTFTHKQAFWKIIFAMPDIGAKNRERVANAAADLQKQKDILVALSAGGRSPRESPEISLVVDINADLNALSSNVKTALTTAGLGDNPVHLRTGVRYHSFNKNQLLYILQSLQIPSTNSIRKSSPTQTVTTTTSSTDDSAITHADLSFSILDSRQQILSNDKTSLSDELESFRSVFKELSVETKSSAAVVLMAREGLVTVGTEMWKQLVNTLITSSIITAIEPLISSVGGIDDFCSIVSVISKPLEMRSHNQ